MNQEHRADSLYGQLRAAEESLERMQSLLQEAQDEMDKRREAFDLAIKRLIAEENRRRELERALARLTAAASSFVAMRSGKRRRELSLAIAEATAALGGGEDE